MRILLTGASGYIAQRLLPALLQEGHHVICLVRDPNRFKLADKFNNPEIFRGSLELLKVDLLDSNSLAFIPKDIDVAYYLVHSMTSASDDFAELEEKVASNFVTAMNQTQVQQVIYLSGIANDGKLSKHLASRLNVEQILEHGLFELTVLRAAIIIGSGSASFEIIRDLIEQLPILIAPNSLKTRCQPIAVRNVVQYLAGVLLKQEAYNKVFDIGGPDVLTYKQMLKNFARERGLQRLILTLPILHINLVAYFLYFFVSTTYPLARSLIESLPNEVICEQKGIEEIVSVRLIPYKEAIQRAFRRIEQNGVVSSWTDAAVAGIADKDFTKNIQVPKIGCLRDVRRVSITKDISEVQDKIMSIGGDNGWYCMNWAWEIRGLLDKLVGGVGLRKWRRDPKRVKVGDAVDFWRVILVDEEQPRLMLYAEMKLPGEAWLEFAVREKNGEKYLKQTASFRPHGILGRLYWWVLVPAHEFVFTGMAKKIAQ